MTDDNSNSENGVVFTAAETKFILCAHQHIEGVFKFDADAVAAKLGLKDGSVARARWNTIKRTKFQGSLGEGPNQTPAKKAASKKRMGDDSGAGDEDEDELGHGASTPKKRARKSKAEKDGVGAKVKKEDVEDLVETTEKESEDELAA